MNIYEFLTLLLGVFSVIILPLIIWTVRSAVRSARIEDKLISLAEDIRDSVTDLKEYKKITDRRVGWLEQNLWRRDRER